VCLPFASPEADSAGPARASSSMSNGCEAKARAPAAAKMSTIDSEVIHDFLMHALKVGLSRV
jgi:hypothetical protein